MYLRYTPGLSYALVAQRAALAGAAVMPLKTYQFAAIRTAVHVQHVIRRQCRIQTFLTRTSRVSRRPAWLRGALNRCVYLRVMQLDC